MHVYILYINTYASSSFPKQGHTIPCFLRGPQTSSNHGAFPSRHEGLQLSWMQMLGKYGMKDIMYVGTVDQTCNYYTYIYIYCIYPYLSQNLVHVSMLSFVNRLQINTLKFEKKCKV